MFVSASWPTDAHSQHSGAQTLACIMDPVVTTNADSGAGSLRQAVIDACPGSTITFAGGVGSPISLSTGQITIDKNLTIQGPGANVLTVQNTAGVSITSRVFVVNIGITAAISGLTVSGGNLDTTVDGGGIYNAGSLTITSSAISNNVGAQRGGGVANDGGTLNITNSTISGNTATTGGGGIYIPTGTFTITNSTVSGNTTTVGSGGGILNISGTLTITNTTITNNATPSGSNGGIRFVGPSGSVTIRNSIIAANVNNSTNADAGYSGAVSFNSLGYNLIGNFGTAIGFTATGDQKGTDAAPLNPLLGPLANNGGPTQTHLLLPGSTAIDKGSAVMGITADQRGTARPFDNPAVLNAVGGDASDIGSVEVTVFGTLTVTKTADTADGVCDADCSLREAVTAAQSGDTIVFLPAVTGTITEVLGTITIDKSLFIDGPGANVLAVSGGGLNRVLAVSGAASNLTMEGLTVTGGNSSGASGGGILVNTGTSLSVINSTISGNTSSSNGGGIRSIGMSASVVNSTVSGNSAGSGGGISISSAPNSTSLSVINSTISGNTATNSVGGGGIINVSGTMTLSNATISNNIAIAGPGSGVLFGGVSNNVRSTIIAANQNNATVADVDGGPVTSQGYNLIGNVGTATGFTATGDQTGTGAMLLNPMLGLLANNGGPTQTHNLLLGSPAIDKGSVATGVTTDQRGRPRPFDNLPIAPATGGDNSDIGAVEIQYVPTAANGNVSGQILDTNNAPVSGVTINLSGTQNRLTITDANGNYRFDNVETNGFYTATPSRANYTFIPANRSFSLLGVHTEASFTATVNGDHSNAIDTTEFFVRQQYLDFLNRAPDPDGFTGWVDTINNCAGVDTSCDRVHVSEMFFRSEEFQQRGYFVYRFYSTAFGHKPDYAAFGPDLQRVSGFLTNEQLEAAKTAFANDFVTRPAFGQYKSLGNAAYVDALMNTAGVNLSNRQALIDGLDHGSLTRAQVLRQIAESGEVYQKYYNQAFVVMEYFGYLQRDPDTLYLNWIDVLNANPADSRHMVEGFVNSAEYRQRFGP